MMISNNHNTKVNKPKKTRNRKPVAPSFALPPRGERCINWLPIAKRELRKRISDLGKHRLCVVEMAITNSIQIIFNKFNLCLIDIIGENEFTLQYDEIINDLINGWNNKLLSDWKGPKLKTSTWKNKLWEGKNGYFKLCKNWADQNKYQVSHIFWIKIYSSVFKYIQNISHVTATAYAIGYTFLFNCLMYACLYSIFRAQIGFPKTRLLPLLVNTVIAKNNELKKYLKNTFDSCLTIYLWKEEESEKYQAISCNKQSNDNKVCAAVKLRCIQYTKHKLIQSFQQINHNNNNNNLDDNNLDNNLDKFIISITFDANGNINNNTKKKQKKHEKTGKNNIIESPQINELLSMPISDYDGFHNQSRSVEYIRSNPMCSMHYHKSRQLSDAQRTNNELRKQIMECKAMLNNIENNIENNINTQPQTQPLISNVYFDDNESITSISNINYNYTPSYPSYPLYPCDMDDTFTISQNSDLNRSTMPSVYYHEI